MLPLNPLATTPSVFPGPTDLAIVRRDESNYSGKPELNYFIAASTTITGSKLVSVAMSGNIVEEQSTPGAWGVDFTPRTEHSYMFEDIYATNSLDGHLREYRSDVPWRSFVTNWNSTRLFDDSPDYRVKTMPLSLYLHPNSHKLYAFVGREIGPEESAIHCFEITFGYPSMYGNLVGRFSFDGTTDHSAVCVDRDSGVVYSSSSDGIVVAHTADPALGFKFLYKVGGGIYNGGLAVVRSNGLKYLLQSGTFESQAGIRVFLIKEFQGQIKLSLRRFVRLNVTGATALDAKSGSFGPRFESGLVVVSDNKKKRFALFSLKQVLDRAR